MKTQEMRGRKQKLEQHTNTKISSLQDGLLSSELQRRTCRNQRQFLFTPPDTTRRPQQIGHKKRKIRPLTKEEEQKKGIKVKTAEELRGKRRWCTDESQKWTQKVAPPLNKREKNVIKRDTNAHEEKKNLKKNR